MYRVVDMWGKSGRAGSCCETSFIVETKLKASVMHLASDVFSQVTLLTSCSKCLTSEVVATALRLNFCLDDSLFALMLNLSAERAGL